MDGLKQRIIGALVLISLVVIFVPMLFDEPHSERSSRTISIPEEPPFPEINAPQPKGTEIPSYRMEEAESTDTPHAQPVPDIKLDKELTAPSLAEPKSIPEPTPEPLSAQQTELKSEPKSEPEADVTAAAENTRADDARSLKGAWLVQLGSFGNADNARRLRDNVRDKGYGSHLQEIPRGDTSLTRVFSGPFADKAEAERAKKALDAAFGLNSLVTSNN